MRHFGAQPAGRTVYLTGGTATATQPDSWASVDRVFYGATIPVEVTEAQATMLTAGGFTVVDTAVLAAAADVFLTAASVDPSWAGEDWENVGTAGTGYNAQYIGTNAGVTYTSSGFRIPPANGSQANVYDDGFGISDAGVMSDSMDAGEWTFTMDFTPLFENPVTCRYYRKYTGQSIPVSGRGLVVESTQDVGGFIAAVVTGAENLIITGGASFIGGTVTGRHQVTLRMSGGVFSIFRGLSKILEKPVVDSTADTSDLIIGPGQIVHGVAWWASGLSDNEVLALHAGAGSVN